MFLWSKFLLPSLLRSVLTRILTWSVWPGGSGGWDGTPALVSRWHFRKSHFVDNRRFPKARRRDVAIGLSIWVTCWMFGGHSFDVKQKYQQKGLELWRFYYKAALVSDLPHCFQTRKDNSAPKLTPQNPLYTHMSGLPAAQLMYSFLLAEKADDLLAKPPTSRLSVNRPPETLHWIRSSRVWAPKIMFVNREEGNQPTGATWLQTPPKYTEG